MYAVCFFDHLGVMKKGKKSQEQNIIRIAWVGCERSGLLGRSGRSPAVTQLLVFTTIATTPPKNRGGKEMMQR